MIGLNMDMPECCVDCPCSHWIGSGPLEGMLMCEALETIEKDHDKSRYLVDDHKNRPGKCPMFAIYYAFDKEVS